MYLHPASFAAVASNACPGILVQAVDGDRPGVRGRGERRSLAHSFAVFAAKDFHGDSLCCAENITSALPAPTLPSETVTLDGSQPHLAYLVALAVTGCTSPFEYSLFPLGMVAQPSKRCSVFVNMLFVDPVFVETVWFGVAPSPPFAFNVILI